jgi:hypothetical protein
MNSIEEFMDYIRANSLYVEVRLEDCYRCDGSGIGYGGDPCNSCDGHGWEIQAVYQSGSVAIVYPSDWELWLAERENSDEATTA